MSAASILWHDYETFGVNPQLDRPCQFAAVRTDYDLNPIAKPMNWFCQIPNDYLPSPRACIITGITPQQTLRDGYIEAEFIRRIDEQMLQPNTCVAGYNSIRFDDEVTRFTLFRNFYDPYEREWRNNNSRWDIIDLVRACYALRPEGIVWPTKEDGSPSFKLEELTQANGISHESAHDAVSDVYATIAMAKLIKTKQHKLYDYGFSLRDKKTVLKRIDLHHMTPLVHVSSRFPAINGCCSVVMPVGLHPTNKNAIIAIDLAQPIDTLLTHSSEQLAELMFTKTVDLDYPTQRPGLKLIYLNRSPFIAPLKTLAPARAEQLNIDISVITKNRDAILQQSGLIQHVLDIYEHISQNSPQRTSDIDSSLYSEGFPTQAEKEWKSRVIATPPELLADFEAPTDALSQKLFRYRARNYPASLTADEATKWQNFRRARLIDNNACEGNNLDQFMQELETLAVEFDNDSNRKAIVRALAEYAQSL